MRLSERAMRLTRRAVVEFRNLSVSGNLRRALPFTDFSVPYIAEFGSRMQRDEFEFAEEVWWE